MSSSTRRRLPPPIIGAARTRAISVAANCDPRTVRTYLAGLPTRPALAERIAAALEAQIAADKERGRG